jgi:hypothetical protein
VLRAPLTALARHHGRRLVVLVERPPGDRRARQAYFASVCALAEAALVDPSSSASSGGTYAQALPPPDRLGDAPEPAVEKLGEEEDEHIGVEDPDVQRGEQQGDQQEDDAEEELVQIATTMAATSNIHDQVRDALADSLSAKLTKQLARAHNLGFSVLLLLDQMEPPGETTSAQWLASPATVEAATAPMLDEHAGVVTELWLRDPRGAFHLLRTGTVRAS